MMVTINLKYQHPHR